MALLIDTGGRANGAMTREMTVKVSSIELPIDKAEHLVKLLEHYRHMVHFLHNRLSGGAEVAVEHFKSDLQLMDVSWRELVSTSAVLQMLQDGFVKSYKLNTSYVRFNAASGCAVADDNDDDGVGGNGENSLTKTLAAPNVGETNIATDNEFMYCIEDTSDGESLHSHNTQHFSEDINANNNDVSNNKRTLEDSLAEPAKRTKKLEAEDARPGSSTINLESTTYTCPIKPCTVVTANQSHLRNHLRKAHPGVLTTCTLCKKTFEVRQTLLRHIQGVHRNLSDEQKMSLYLIPCDFEKYNLPPKERFVRRQSDRVSKMPTGGEIPLWDYRCQIAGCKFKTFKHEELAKHEQTSHGMVFACQHIGCYRSFENQAALDAHMAEFHPTNAPGFACPIEDCLSHFDLLSHLKKHMRKQHLKEYTTCQRCNQSFSNRDALSKHVRYYHRDLTEQERQELLMIPVDNSEWIESVHHCALQGCNLTFLTKDELNAHIKELHPDIYVTCRFCHRVSATVQQLKYHIMYMHEEGEYYCPEEGCNFVGKYRKELKTHRFRNHKPTVKCKVADCGEVMVESNLTRHMLERHQVKKYQCTWPECDMTFMKHFHLKRHIRVHMNFKRFLCKWPNCNYASEQKATVMTHVRVCHLKLPRTQREQKEKNIEIDPDTQNPYDWIEVLPEDVIV